MTEILFVMPTTYLTTKVHRILKKQKVKHDMVIKPSSIFSDCGMAVSIEERDYTPAKTAINAGDITEYNAYIEKSSKWVEYGQ